MNLFHRLLEEFSVLGAVDGVKIYAYELDAVLVEESLLRQLAAERKTRLSAERSEKAVGTLLDYYSLEGISCKRFEIDFIGERFVCHYGCRVGIAQNDVYACILENAAGLSACIVEFGSLSYDNGTRTDN